MANADLLGRESVLITGLEGSGKSHYIMQQVKKILDDGFEYNIYIANVNGITLEHPNLKIVDKDFNWLTAEPNSMVIYDEAGTIERFSNLKNKLYCEELQMISQRRKTGVLLVFVAQDSKMINSAMRALLKFHFHFSNPYNDSKKTHCFVFPTVKSSLSNDNKSWHNDATEQFEHTLDPEIFPLYKSIDEQKGAKHNKKKQVNKKARMLFIGAGIAVLLCVGLAIGAFKFAQNYKQRVFDEKINTQATTSVVSSVASTVVPDSAVAGIAPNAENEQEMNERARRTKELYDQRLPQDYQILVNNNDLRVANVMLLNGHCTAYNAYAERLNVSQSYCNQQLHGAMLKVHVGGMQGITQDTYSPQSNSNSNSITAPPVTSAPAVTTAPATSSKEPVFNPNSNNDYLFNSNKK